MSAPASSALILDTETTGLVEPQAIEVAFLLVENLETLAVTGDFRQLYSPTKPIELGALATHHILEEDLIDQPVTGGFHLPEGTQYLIGHNIDYDWAVIGSPPVRRICTLAMARAMWPGLDSHRQEALMYHISADRVGTREKLRSAHSAAHDIWFCRSILQHLLVQMPDVRTWEALWRWSEVARIPTVAPFGKYKGQPIREIPRQYYLWAAKQSGFDPYFLRAMKESV